MINRFRGVSQQTLTAKESAIEPARFRFRSVRLERAPEVVRFVERLGLGALREESINSFMGRNDNWAGPTTTGAEVFVKHFGGRREDAQVRLRRVVASERLFAQDESGELRGPGLLGVDLEHRLAAFTLLPDARSGAELASDDEFDAGLCRRVGRQLGILHATDPEPGLIDGSEHPLPSLDELQALSLEVYAQVSAAQLESWRLIQSDAELVAAVRRLRAAEDAAGERRPIHGDLRLDQFLLAGDELYLGDWEELRLGDPARDLGGFAGEWLHRAILGIPAEVSRAAGYTFGHEATHEEILQHGAAQVAEVRPFIEACVAGYRETRERVDAGLAVRAARFAGWHTFDRMQAAAAKRMRLSAVDRASAGIGRNLLLSPESFVDLLGLGGLR
jgi:hypothetical protein